MTVSFWVSEFLVKLLGFIVSSSPSHEKVSARIPVNFSEYLRTTVSVY